MSENNNSLISTQIITASLTMITVIGAFAVFIIEKREINYWYYIITGLAFVCFILSIIFGGKGLSTQDTTTGYNKFYNWQTRTAILGIIMFCASIFFGNEKTNETDEKIDKLEKSIIENQIKVDIYKEQIDVLDIEVKELRKLVDSIEKATVPNN